jgi:YegS/Rv2252/BmrU family lipid kinase
MQRIDFIVNPIAGGRGKDWVLSSIRRHLDTSMYTPEYLVTDGVGVAEQMARESQADIVVAVGGDGTVSEVARGLAGSDKVLGVIPCGSGDGLALHLGCSRITAMAVKTLNEQCITSIDVAEMNGKSFLCTAGFGLDASVSLDFARSTRRGLANYIALAWDEWNQHPGETYTITSKSGESWTGKAVFVTIANANQWGNQARIAPMASLQDGLLDVIVVRPFRTVEIPDLATRLMTGLTHTSRHVLHFSDSVFHIHREHPGAIHYDGDPSEGGTEFDLSVRPKAMKVIVPSSKIHKI